MKSQNSNSRGMIYLIYRVNDPAMKVYVGQTTTPFKIRWYAHCANSNCRYLHNAIKKYGPAAFTHYVIEDGVPVSLLGATENRWIEFFGARDHKHGYNLKNGGAQGLHSKETRKRISAGGRARWARHGEREKMSAVQRARWARPGEREKMSAVQAARCADPSVRKEMAAKSALHWSKKGSRERAAARCNTRYTKSEEREKVSISVTARYAVPGAKEKHSRACGGRPFTDQFGAHYETQMGASRLLGIPQGCIGSVLHRKSRQTHGYVFTYLKESDGPL